MGGGFAGSGDALDQEREIQRWQRRRQDGQSDHQGQHVPLEKFSWK